MGMPFRMKLLVIVTTLFITSTTYAAQSVCYKFYGINPEIEKNIFISLKIDNTHCIKVNPKTSIQQTIKQDKKIIKKAIEPYGYFNPVIQRRLIYRNNAWIASYQIFLGTSIQISELQIELSGPGQFNKNLLDYIHQFPMKRGDIFTVSNYLNAQHKLFSIARNQGYIKVDFQNKITINPKQHTAVIHIHLVTGNRYYFGNVNFKSDVYAASFLNRLLTFSRYQPFSSKVLGQLQQAMENSYYFKSVIIEPQFDHITKQQVPIDISYTVPKAKTYELGIGYGTLTGPRLSAKMSLRRVTETGQHFEAEAKLSSVLSYLSGNYYIPGKNPLNETYFMGANVKKFQPRAGTSVSSTLSGGYEMKQTYTRESMTVNYLIDHFKIFSAPPPQTSHLFYPDLKFIVYNADNIVNPSNGIATTFDLSGASKNILASTSYAQLNIHAKLIVSPLSFSRIIFRTDLGYTTVQQLSVFPLTKRFFAGGVDSIRGFADSSIGPGRYLEVGSIEYQNKIHGNVYGAVFYDIGTAANHFNERLNRGVGVGVVYQSMVGPIKLYLAKALSKSGRPNSIEFSAGPEFS